MAGSSPRGRLARSRRGASVVEFVVIAGLVIMAALFTCSVLGLQVKSSLSRLGGSTFTDSSASELRPSPSAALVETPVATRQTPVDLASTVEVKRLSNQRCLAAATLMTAAVALFAMRRRPRLPAAGPQSLPRADELIDKRQKLLLVLQKHLQRANNVELSVRQLMSGQLVAVRPNATVDKIRHFMQLERVRHVLVCQGQSRLVGVISDRDLSQRSGRTAADIMTPTPLSVRPDTSLISAATTILNHGISCLPVVEDDRLCGVLTTTDLVLGLQATLQLLEKLACQPDWSGAAPV